jgi:hypothetical protein
VQAKGQPCLAGPLGDGRWATVRVATRSWCILRQRWLAAAIRPHPSSADESLPPHRASEQKASDREDPGDGGGGARQHGLLTLLTAETSW